MPDNDEFAREQQAAWDALPEEEKLRRIVAKAVKENADDIEKMVAFAKEVTSTSNGEARDEQSVVYQMMCEASTIIGAKYIDSEKVQDLMIANLLRASVKGLKIASQRDAVNVAANMLDGSLPKPGKPASE